MDVQMVNGLPAVPFGIDNKTAALFFAAMLFCQFLRPEKQLPCKLNVFRPKFHQICNVLLGN
jgi:hypothetical protein